MTTVEDCTCEFVWSAGGTRVHMEPRPLCPFHGSRVETRPCWFCERWTIYPSRTGPRLSPGWAMRADGALFSCPEHLEEMPPCNAGKR